MEAIRVLIQTTIAYAADDWHVARFSLLADHLSTARGLNGHRFDVTARNLERRSGSGADPILSSLGALGYDELWLFAVDSGDGLNAAERAGIASFVLRGGGILTARDHQDLGSCLCDLPDIGAAHQFHSRNCDPRPDHRRADDAETSNITWPNYHSGRNGDVQRLSPVDPKHPLLRSSRGANGIIQHFPAHPHEGSVHAPNDLPGATVVAAGRSRVTGRAFNLVVACGAGTPGRWVAHSSFHHFADYNWDLSKGAPSFVTEAPGEQIARAPYLLDDVRTYAVNAAGWLCKRHECSCLR
jgi:hypothetical protein